MESKIPWAKLGRYVSGESDRWEQKEVKSWIADNPERQQLVNELKEIWDQSEQHSHKWDVDAAWSAFSGELSKRNYKRSLRLVKSPGEKVFRNQKQHASGRKWKHRKRVASYIAVAAIILVAAFLSLSTQEESDNREQGMQELIAEKGQRSQFKLSDGSMVWLNAESRLKIPAHFASDVREVYLRGEAYFEIKSNAEKPFIVHAGNSVTKVLGTRFNVRAYDETSVQLVVEEGRVAFGSDMKTLNQAPELTHNQMGLLEEKRQVITRDVPNTDQYTSWKQGKLVFSNATLASVMSTLERWYDINCHVTDSSLIDRTVTTSFEGESLAEVLKVISLAIGVDYKKEKKNITFRPKQ